MRLFKKFLLLLLFKFAIQACDFFKYNIYIYWSMTYIWQYTNPKYIIQWLFHSKHFMYSINRTSIVPQKCLSCPTLVTNSTKHKNYLNVYHCRWVLLLLHVIEMKSYSIYKLNIMCGCELSMLLYAVSYCMNVSQLMHFTVINHLSTFCCHH